MSEEIDGLPVERLVGRSLVINYGPGNQNNRTLHIRAAVDGEWLVARWWSRRKQRWVYSVEHPSFVKFLLCSGNAILRSNAISSEAATA